MFSFLFLSLYLLKESEKRNSFKTELNGNYGQIDDGLVVVAATKYTPAAPRVLVVVST